MPNLIPVIVQKDLSDGDDFLLTDTEGWFYIWNEIDGRLWRFQESSKLEDVVTRVRTEQYAGNELVQQFNKNSWRPPPLPPKPPPPSTPPPKPPVVIVGPGTNPRASK